MYGDVVIAMGGKTVATRPGSTRSQLCVSHTEFNRVLWQTIIFGAGDWQPKEKAA